MKISWTTFHLLLDLGDSVARDIQDMMNDMECSDSRMCQPRTHPHHFRTRPDGTIEMVWSEWG